MTDINDAIENLARTFYELDGTKWEDATEFIQQAVRTHVRSGLLGNPELLAGSFLTEAAKDWNET